MAYQALYRVWRSQRFEDIVGQKAVTQTLKMLLFPTKPHMPTCLQDPEEPERRVQQRFSQKQSTVRTVKTASHATNAKCVDQLLLVRKKM